MRRARGLFAPSLISGSSFCSSRLTVLLVAVVLALQTVPRAAGLPARAGEAVIARHVTLAPSWCDPSTTPPQITPFGMLYSIHDALHRPRPAQKMGGSLREA